jgi:hypothetical protein
MKLEAVIFDMDGVLWDSSRSHEEAFREAFGEQGFILPSDFYEMIAGMNTRDAVRLLCDTFLPEEHRSEEICTRLVSRKQELAAVKLAQVQPDPSVHDVLRSLRLRGVRLALATSASRKTMQLFLRHLPSDSFDVALCSEDVSEAKPSPAMYKEIARRLELPVDRCLVIEDSPAGLRAALEAGTRVIAYRSASPPLPGVEGHCSSLMEIPAFVESKRARVTLSICIANTNHRDLLDNALRSIYQNPPSCTFEVLVVDNASTDGSADMVKSKYREVILTRNTERLGYPANCNKNMQKATGEYFLILNEDVEILPGSLDVGVRFLQENSQVGMVGAAMILPTGQIQLTSARHFPTILTELLGWSRLPELFPRNKFFGHYLMSYWPHDTVREVDLVLEAGMLVRRSAVEQVGMMDEGFFFCYDGPDWCRRFWNAGWKVVYHPDMRLIHYDGQSSREGGRPNFWILAESIRSSVRYYTKHHGPIYALAFRCVMVMVFSLYIVKHAVASLFVWSAHRRKGLMVRLATAVLMFRRYAGLGGSVRLR